MSASSFAIYRLPHTDVATFIQQTEGEPAELHSCTELNGRSGFVVAPFEVTEEQPLLLIRPDVVESVLVESVECKVERENSAIDCSVSVKSPSTFHFPLSSKSTYAIDFANYHSQLQLGTFQKIVLARCVDESSDAAINPLTLFRRACDLYPRMFISLVSTPQSGIWLTATPEILLQGINHQWRTIALAGTMKLEGEGLLGEGESTSWSIKNIKEQRYVSTYITECLEQYTSDFREEGPTTVRAADLVHLRSDFTFTLPDHQHIGDLLQTLHPTPAVCGLPKRDAFKFITHNEHTPRRYYSGFMGMLNPDGDTHLYVSLRCMNIEGNYYHLYAGGGLLKDSVMEQEWQETEAKLQTMRRCLAIKIM